MFANFSSMFLNIEFVDPKGMFKKICRQHPFEFLVMFDLCREWQKKMISKILMCHCYKEEFLTGDNKSIKSKIHFYCKCWKEHSHYVLFCKEHSFRTDFAARSDYQNREMKEKCDCKSGLFHEVCGFCFSVRYLLNFKYFKICAEELPDTFIKKIVTLDH